MDNRTVDIGQCVEFFVAGYSLSIMKLRWRFGIIAGLFLAIFALYPQMKMIYLRGSDWNGHYAYNDIDEVAYASYLKALIDGRPRKNDPYTGHDDTAQHPQPESLFSIQFAAPYTIAVPARLFGIGASWAMTIAGAVAAFLTALAIFWLVGMATDDSWYAMAGALVVLAGGALFAGEGAIGEILDTSYAYPYFPGFRRYIPAMAFPAFFALAALVWKIFVSEGSERKAAEGPLVFLLIGAASLAFGYTVFSYFYVWTTAAAWLGCLFVVFLVIRPEGFAGDIKKFALLGVGCGAFLLPYAYLLSNRSHTMDDVQLLVLTRSPDLLRVPEIVSFAVLVIIAAGVVVGRLRLIDRAVMYGISLAMVPFVVFNQQIITGKALQPIHYQVFIGNYVAGLALVIATGLIIRGLVPSGKIKLAFAALALIAAAWGFVECHYTVRILDDVNVIRDESMPVGRRLTELAAGSVDKHEQVVMHFGIAEADDLPTIAPQSVLWARHQHVFAGVTWQENKERYYQYLYYGGITPQQLAEGMKRNGDFVSIIALFGWGRHTDRLNSGYKPLSFGEIDAEVLNYANYIRDFDPATSGIRPLDYAVSSVDSPPDYSFIDKWYERDDGEVIGKYVLYKLKFRR